MSQFLYLTEKNHCPVCYVRRNGDFDGNCHNCGVRLFPSTGYDFQKFEDETPVRFWWAWTGSESGWKHRDHFMVKSAKPQERHQEQEKLASNYGRHTTPEEVQKAGFGKINRTARKSKTKIPAALKPQAGSR